MESDDDTVPNSSDSEDEGLVMKKVMPKVSFSPDIERTHNRGRLIYAEDDEGKLGVDYNGRNDTF